MSVIGKCPDCGSEILEGHISHRCETTEDVYFRSDTVETPSGLTMISGCVTMYRGFHLPVEPA